MATTKTSVKEMCGIEFRMYVCELFGLDKYSVSFANEIKELLVCLALGKRNAPNKLLGFIEQHKDAVGTDDPQTFINIVKQIGSRLLADDRKKEVGKRKSDPEVKHVLCELNKKLSTGPIDEFLDNKCIQDHIRLLGEHPTKENILELYSFHAFNEPKDYVSVHMKRTRYKSPINYVKSLAKHLYAIASQVLA